MSEVLQQTKDLLDRVVEADKPLDKSDILDLILPPKQQQYAWPEIDVALNNFNEELELVLKRSNEKFDEILDEQVQEKLKNLCSDLNKTQVDVIKLQFNIAQAKEQFDTVKKVCNGKVVQDWRELLENEKQLKQSLRRSKFQPVIIYFERFLAHLDSSIEACKKLLAYKASDYKQCFDWTHYHQAMFLLRACGKTMIDLDKFERLYQSRLESLLGFAFKQPFEKMDLNNFIEFQATYSLESQLDAILDFPSDQSIASTQRIDFSQFSMNPDVAGMLNSSNSIKYELFLLDMEKLGSITIECCRLLIDLNLNYMEAHLTDGINIDKMNGCDNSTGQVNDQQVQPLYAFSPQEYITQIGQHFLTLRKQTEQFDQIDNRPLKLALEYLQHAQNIHLDVRLCSTVTEIILKCIAKHCVRSLIGRTTNSVLSKLTPNGRRQLATDAMYLDNVLEDLNLLDFNETYVEKFKSLFAQ